MAYSGSTAASSVANPPTVFAQGLIGGRHSAGSTSAYAGRKIWFYNSSDASTSWMSAGYFTDGQKLGMSVGDLLIGLSASTESSTGHVFVGGALVTTNSTNGWNLSTGGSVTSTFT